MSLPTHVAVILDGNRRWARSRGLPLHEGHLKGLANVRPFLTWCNEAGIRRVTLWLLSTDNLSRRRDELVPLFAALARTILGLAQQPRWRLDHVGDPRLLSAELVRALDTGVSATRAADGIDVNLAIGYGGTMRSPRPHAPSRSSAPARTWTPLGWPARKSNGASPRTFGRSASRTLT